MRCWRGRRSRRLFGSVTSRGLERKHLSELGWWERELGHTVAWYNGERTLYGKPPPTPEQKQVRSTVEASACATLLAQTLHRYPKALEVSQTHFAGKTILDLGCGPLPYSIAFVDCRIVGLDPLVAQYEAAGFPLAEFSDQMTFVRGFAEDMPFASQSFDAVISVNAIDHVDNFGDVAREIRRVLKRGGILRTAFHYHQPTELEPQALNDNEVLVHLGDLGIEKISERVPEGPSRDSDADRTIDPTEKHVVWANDIAK